MKKTFLYLFNSDSIKKFISIIAFLSSIIIGFIAIFIPPAGIIHSSVLYFIAQLLLFTSAILGINFKGLEWHDKIKRVKDDEDDEA